MDVVGAAMKTGTRAPSEHLSLAPTSLTSMCPGGLAAGAGKTTGSGEVHAFLQASGVVFLMEQLQAGR